MRSSSSDRQLIDSLERFTGQRLAPDADNLSLVELGLDSLAVIRWQLAQRGCVLDIVELFSLADPVSVGGAVGGSDDTTTVDPCGCCFIAAKRTSGFGSSARGSGTRTSSSCGSLTWHC